MKKIIKYLDYIIYWSIILIPFSISIASSPMNVFMGLLIFSFLAKKILKGERIFIRTAINIPLLFLFIITCISLINSINYRDSFKGGILRLLQYVFVFFAVVQELKDRRHITKIIFSMGAGLILSSLDAIWQVKFGHDFIRGYVPIINIGLVRATASFKDSNTFGVYLGAIAPIIFGLALYPDAIKPRLSSCGWSRVGIPPKREPQVLTRAGLHYLKGIKKIFLVFISLIGLAGLALTYSRPTLLAIYVTLFFLGFIRKNKILIILLIIFTLISPFLLPRSVKNWAKEVGYNPLRFMCNDDRIAIYRNSINMIKDHSFIGVGANTFMKNYKKYKESPEYRNVITSDYLYAHNNFLHMAAEIGLIGLGIFLWLLYKLFRETIKIYKKLDDHYLKIVSISLLACLIAFLVNGLTESSLYSSRVALIFWYLMSFSLALKKFIDADK